MANEVLDQAARLRDRATELIGVGLILCWFEWWPFRSVNWHNHFGINALTPVRDQGGCGSCVAFGTTATLESMIIIERNLITDRSEAELLNCGGASCGGWWPSSAIG